MSQSVAGSTGFTRCMSKPASRDRRRSTSCPQPVSATSTAPGPSSRRGCVARLRSRRVWACRHRAPRSPAVVSRERQRLFAVGGAMHFVPFQRSMSARLSSASWLSSAIRILRRTGATWSVVESRCRSARASLRSNSGSRTVNSLPRSCPALAAMISPPCSSTSARTSASPIPRPPLVVDPFAGNLREQLKDARHGVGGNADTAVAHARFPHGRFASAS